MIATSTPYVRTRPSPSTASANQATKEMASSVRVSGLSTSLLLRTKFFGEIMN